jgi:transcriptional regulator with XRE-family HTH domain
MNMDLGSWSARVAAAIRAEMASQRRSGAALARELGVAEPTVTARLDGEIPFDLVELERVAGWLGLTPSELVARADEPAT